ITAPLVRSSVTNSRTALTMRGASSMFRAICATGGLGRTPSNTMNAASASPTSTRRRFPMPALELNKTACSLRAKTRQITAALISLCMRWKPHLKSKGSRWGIKARTDGPIASASSFLMLSHGVRTYARRWSVWPLLPTRTLCPSSGSTTWSRICRSFLRPSAARLGKRWSGRTLAGCGEGYRILLLRFEWRTRHQRTTRCAHSVYCARSDDLLINLRDAVIPLGVSLPTEYDLKPTRETLGHVLRVPKRCSSIDITRGEYGRHG